MRLFNWIEEQFLRILLWLIRKLNKALGAYDNQNISKEYKDYIKKEGLDEDR